MESKILDKAAREAPRRSGHDVLLCYKIDGCTISTKYRSCQRISKTSTEAMAAADDLGSTFRVRVSNVQQDAHKDLLKKMRDGLDEKERLEAVPIVKKI